MNFYWALPAGRYQNHVHRAKRRYFSLQNFRFKLHLIAPCHLWITDVSDQRNTPAIFVLRSCSHCSRNVQIRLCILDESPCFSLPWRIVLHFQTQTQERRESSTRTREAVSQHRPEITSLALLLLRFISPVIKHKTCIVEQGAALTQI